MATLARLEKEKEGESKTESRSLKQDYKSTKRSERKSMYSCPGEDKCKKVTCTHTRVRKNVEEEQKYVFAPIFTSLPLWRRERSVRDVTDVDYRTKDTQRMTQLIMKKCHGDGYPLSEKYATYWADKYPGDLDLAVAAAKSDLDKRKLFTSLKTREHANHVLTGERDINDAGRINYEHERHAAMETIGFDTRDAVVDFIEREDWLFKDLDVNVRTTSTSPTSTSLTAGSNAEDGSRARMATGHRDARNRRIRSKPNNGTRPASLRPNSAKLGKLITETSVRKLPEER
jgi:hypothetical protein